MRSGKEIGIYYENLNNQLKSTPGAYKYLSFLQDSIQYGLMNSEQATALLGKFFIMKSTKWGKKICTK